MRTPNVVVSGTPGVGKTTFCEELSQSLGDAFIHINVAKDIEAEKLYSVFDDTLHCSVFDDAKVNEYVEELVESRPQGGLIIDFHSVDFMSPHCVDRGIVLRANTDVLYDRLLARGYSEEKVRGNVEAEIFEVCLNEVRSLLEIDEPRDERFKLLQLLNNNVDDLECNVQASVEFVNAC